MFCGATLTYKAGPWTGTISSENLRRNA